MQQTFYIIDNETDSINRLKSYFEDYPNYLCLGASTDYEEAMNTILKYSPDVILADIDVTIDGDSLFNFANAIYQYKKKLPTFIAMSAFKEKAYDVIKNGFFDILLKPLREFDLRRALMRYDKEYVDEPSTTLCLKSYKDYRFVDTDDILYLKADNNSTDFFMSDGKSVSGYQNMKHFEAILPSNFIRIHHSYIINMNHVTRIHFGKSKCTVKNVNAHIPFSRTYRDNVEFLKDVLAKSAYTLN